MRSRFLCLLSAGILMAQPAADPQATGRKALDLLLAHKYTELIEMVSPQSKTANTEATLSAKAPAAWGAMQSVGTASVRALGDSRIVTIPVKFANQDVTFQISLNGAGQVGVIQPLADPWRHPDYSKPTSFTERELTIGTKYRLGATLTVPNGAGPFPGVVLVHDAGLADRDEIVGAVKVFKDLAEGLASRGVMVLRYDKRVRTYPGVGQTRDYTAEPEIIEDAVIALAALRAQPELKTSKAFAMGLGFGGYLMPRVAEADGKLAGMAIVNGNERPLEDLALEEAAYREVTGPQLAVIKESVAKIKKLNAADDDAQALLGKGGPFWLDLKGYDPAGQAKLLNIPMLILQGERDFVGGMKDFAAWKAALGAAKGLTMKSYPALDHVLAAGTGKSTDADYRKPGQHVAVEVVDDLAKWFNQ